MFKNILFFKNEKDNLETIKSLLINKTIIDTKVIKSNLFNGVILYLSSYRPTRKKLNIKDD